ncbi:YeiH family protein [Nonomuraea soli]|uniref:Putative integral membrane protein (TIGR00698 family) n=1 Tax=Nonomuraea soli TaxID=1032476 RepID=A0A7W0CPG4_9ACTN|nr:putative sulfate exporter family transporter [Nonomuraea soli]MBA2894812.1 putative integral membrane protein (TIGR00698 family) [Nonomuraea soli]
MASIALSRTRLHLPGLVAACAAVMLATVLSRLVPALSPAVIAVTAGATLSNLGWLPDAVRPGLQFVAKRVLRVAIVLLGLQIAVPEVLGLGAGTLGIVAAATGTTFVLTPLIARRLGLSPGTGLLVGTGVSICGAAAVAAMRSATDTDDDEAAGALSVVVLYGSAAIVVVPLLAGWLGLSPQQLGVWTGASVHEVAQVAAIGAASGASVLTIAVTVKLARVVLLAPMVAITSFRLAAGRRQGQEGPMGTRQAPPVMPLFVGGFLAMVALRSLGWAPAPVVESAPQVTALLLAASLFGLGAGIDLRRLATGGRPLLLLGAISTALIMAISLVGVTLAT